MTITSLFGKIHDLAIYGCGSGFGRSNCEFVCRSSGLPPSLLAWAFATLMLALSKLVEFILISCRAGPGVGAEVWAGAEKVAVAGAGAGAGTEAGES